MNKKIITLLLSIAVTSVAMAQHTITLNITNPLNTARDNAPVVFSIKKYGDIKSAVVKINGNEIPCQLDDLNQDGVEDELCFVTDLGRKETKNATITLYNIGEPRQYPAKVFAEMVLRNPKVTIKNKHNLYLSSLTINKGTDVFSTIHHHGVAFESELVAYRVYFDNRQTIDLYGKYKKQLEIKDTQFYPDKQQKAAGYGDDVLWVGNTFGLGAMRGWDGKEQQLITDVNFQTQRIISNGPVRTIVEVEDRGWLADPSKPRIIMTIRYTLYAGHRDCDVDVTYNKNVPDYKFSTGIINVKNSTEYTDHKGLRGCWGTDWPAGTSDTINYKRETVGLGIYIPKTYIHHEIPADANYGFVIGTPTNKIHYGITFCSNNETFGFHNATDWFDYLKKWEAESEHPIAIKIK